MKAATTIITAKEAKDAQEWATAVTNLPVRRIPSHTYYQGTLCRRHPGGLFHCNGNVFGTYYVPAGNDRFLGVSLPSGSAPVPPDQCEIRFDPKELHNMSNLEILVARIAREQGAKTALTTLLAAVGVSAEGDDLPRLTRQLESMYDAVSEIEHAARVLGGSL
jgi:hypothetical protein